MSPSRRDFLGMGTLAVAATAVPLMASTPASVQTANDTALYHTDAATMQKHVGSEFVIERVGVSQVRLVLEAVKEFPRKNVSAGECFSLQWRLVEGQSLAEGLYSLQHAAFGRTLLAIAPKDDRGLMYEAVINHRKA